MSDTHKCSDNHFGSWFKGILSVCYSSYQISNFKLAVMVCLVFRCKTMHWISLLDHVWCSEYHTVFVFCMVCRSFEIHNKIRVFQKLLYRDYSYIWGEHHLQQELYVQSTIGRNWRWQLTVGTKNTLSICTFYWSTRISSTITINFLCVRLCFLCTSLVIRSDWAQIDMLLSVKCFQLQIMEQCSFKL
jgi:hypothetical protein